MVLAEYVPLNKRFRKTVAGIAAGIALSVSGCMTAPTKGDPLPLSTSAETTAAPETETETETETGTETAAETTAESETTAKETFEVLEGEPIPYELLGYVGDSLEDDGGELMGKIAAPETDSAVKEITEK